MAHHPFPWRDSFLAALREYPVLNHACKAVGIDRVTVWRARQADDTLAKEIEDALEDGIDRAEQEAFRRGVVGFEEPVIDKGRLCYVYRRVVREDGKVEYEPVLDASDQPVPLTVRKHSDALLALVLKGRRRAYSTERTELTGADGGPIVTDETQRSARVAALLDLASRRKDIAGEAGEAG